MPPHPGSPPLRRLCHRRKADVGPGRGLGGAVEDRLGELHQGRRGRRRSDARSRASLGSPGRPSGLCDLSVSVPARCRADEHRSSGSQRRSCRATSWSPGEAAGADDAVQVDEVTPSGVGRTSLDAVTSFSAMTISTGSRGRRSEAAGSRWHACRLRRRFDRIAHVDVDVEAHPCAREGGRERDPHARGSHSPLGSPRRSPGPPR